MLVKQSRNLIKDGIIKRITVKVTKTIVHWLSNTFWSIFLRREVFWKMFLFHWLKKLSRQTLYREKTITKVIKRLWCHRDWTLKTVFEISFRIILIIKFGRITIRSRFMVNDFGTNYYWYYFHYYHYYYHFF